MQFLDLAGVKRIKQYIDDSIVNFITNSVSNLTNYYLKSETYTKSEVETLIAAINQFYYEIAASTSAVSSPANNVLYLIGPTGTGEDKYEEYVYSSSNWVKIGDTSISLSGYVTTQMLNTALADYTNTTTLNTLLAGKQDTINDLSDIRTGSQNNVKYTSQSLTNTQKTQARTNIGAGTYNKPSSGIPAADLAAGVVSVGLDNTGTLVSNIPTVNGLKYIDGYDGAVYALGPSNSDGNEDYILATTDFVESNYVDADTYDGDQETISGALTDLNTRVNGKQDNMVMLTYGTSTWNDFITAYNKNAVVYCYVPTDANGRLAFMAWKTPDFVEFQYYRTVSSHSATQQGDQVFIYKLTSENAWSTTTREAMMWTQAGNGLQRSVSGNNLTYSVKVPSNSGLTVNSSGVKVTTPLPSTSASDNGKVLSVVNGAATWANDTIPTESTVAGWGFTKNTGTLTGVSFNGNAATVTNGVASITATFPTLVIDVGEEPTSAPSGTFAQCQSAIRSNRMVALMVTDDEDGNKYLYVHQNTGTYHNNNFVDIKFYRVGENYIFWYTLSSNDSLTKSFKQIGTLTGVKFNNTNATVSNGVASITATIPPDNVFVIPVTKSGTTYSTTVTKAEASEALYAGKLLFVLYNKMVMPLRRYDSDDYGDYYFYAISNSYIYTMHLVAGSSDNPLSCSYSETAVPSAVTDSTVSGWGYIKSYTETDPVFSASAAAGITSSDINSWNSKGNAKIFYGTCNSDADYINKTVVCSDFTSEDLVKGALIFVTFDYTNNVDEEDVKLNVNNTGSLYIREPYGESNSVSYLRSKSILQANCTYLFTYNGTYWVLLTGDSDKNTTYSIISQSEAQTGTSTTERLVSAASLKRDIEYRMSQNQADWNETTTTSLSYIKNKPTVPTVPTISTNVVSDKASDIKTSSPKSVYSEIHPTVVDTQPSSGFVPNVLYRLGTLTGSVAFTLATPSDNTIVNHYYWTFTAGSTAPTITWPSGISWFGGSAPTITAGKHYDVSILDNIAVCMEV